MRICILGSEAAGKTCFLGGLAILSEPNRDSALHVIGADEAAEAGSPSQIFLNEVAGTLRAGEWPPPTTLTRDIQLDLRFRQSLLRITAIDYPGESFREALNELDNSRQETLIAHMLAADYLLIMLDPVFDLPDESNLSTAERQHVHERQNAHVAGIRKIYDDVRGNRRSLPRVGLVVTKADSIGALEQRGGAEGYIAERGAPLLERIRSWGVETECFAVSAVGEVGDTRRPPKTLAPFGYDAIFDWVLSSTRRARRAKFIRWVVAPLAIATLAAGIALFLQTRNAERIVADTNLPLDRRVQAANRPIYLSGGLKRATDALVAGQLPKFAERFENLEGSEELDRLRGDFALLESLEHHSRRHEIEDFRRLLSEGDRKLRIRRIRAMAGDAPELLALCQSFLNDFPAAEESPEIEAIAIRLRGLERDAQREAVRRVVVRPGDRDSLNRKATAIMEYALAHRTEEASREMERAADAVRRLASTDTFRVHLSAVGTFLRARKFEVRLYVRDLDDPAYQLLSSGKVKRSTWSVDEAFQLRGWSPGVPIKLEAVDLRFFNEIVGTATDSSPLSIRLLGGKGIFENDPGFGGKYLEGGFLNFTSSIEGFSTEDWALIEKYVYPGNAW